MTPESPDGTLEIDDADDEYDQPDAFHDYDDE